MAAKHEVSVNNASATHFKKHMAHARCIHLSQFKTHLHYHLVSSSHLSQYEDRLGLCQIKVI